MQSPSPYAAFAPPPPPPVYRQNVFVPPGVTAAPLLGHGLRIAKLVLGIVQTLTVLAGLGCIVTGFLIGGHGGGETLIAIGGGLFLLWELAIFAYAVVSIIWVYKFWSWIPPEHRHTDLWKKYISPGQAAFFMLIPFFGIFWLIVMNLGIADVLDRMRVAYPTNKPSAKTIALINTIVGFVFFPASPFVDYFFDRHVEAMAADMQRHMTAKA